MKTSTSTKTSLRVRPKLPGFEPKLAVQMAIRALEIAESMEDDVCLVVVLRGSEDNPERVRFHDICLCLGLVTRILPELLVSVTVRGTGQQGDGHASFNRDLPSHGTTDGWRLDEWTKVTGRPGELIDDARNTHIVKIIAQETVERLKRIGLIFEEK